MNNWYGWFIEQSFDDQSIFDKYKTVKMKSEAENWKEHIVQISSDDLDSVVKWLTKHLKPAWYAHLVMGEEICVVYKDKFFRIKSNVSFKEIAEYGRKQGIIEDQLPGIGLFKLARDSGF